MGYGQTLDMPAGRADGIGQCARIESKDDTKVFIGRIDHLPKWGRLWEKQVWESVGNVRSSGLGMSSSRCPPDKEAGKLRKIVYVSQGRGCLSEIGISSGIPMNSHSTKV